MVRNLIALLALFALAACAAGREKGALPPQQAAAVAYVHDGPPSITLVTMVNNRSGSGGHSALLINGSQRVLFDPAGSFRHDTITEYGDVLYGFSDRRLAMYKSAHSRSTYHVVTQEIEVPAPVAERALQLVQENGAVSQALCSNATSSVLRQLPGFEDVKMTFFPDKLMKQIAQRPDVKEEKYFENDAGDIVDGLESVGLSE